MADEDIYDYNPTAEDALTTPGAGSVNDAMGSMEARIPSGVLNLLHPHRRSFRGLVLLGACFLTFGAYFSMDVPGAIGTSKMTTFFGVDSLGYSMLYSIYAIPNMVLPLMGGLLIDRYLGPKFGGILFALIVLLGQTIFSLGALFPTSGGYWVALIGRFVFGLGGENLSVTQSTYCAKWFAGKELATAFSITLSFARFGSAVNFIISPTIANWTSIGTAIWLATGTCVLSLCAALYLAFLDWRGDAAIPLKEDDDGDAEVEIIRVKDVLNFSAMYWYLTSIVVFFYISVFVFVQFSSGFFEYQYGKSDEQAGNLNSVIYMTSAVASPFVGILIDRVGYPLYFLAVACGGYSLMMVVMMFFTFVPPVIPMLGCGICYTLVASSLWPTVPLVVKAHEVGTAYGVAFSVQNFGQVVAPLFIGLFIDSDTPSDFVYSVFFFAVTSALACALCISMICTDFVTGNRVNVSSARKKQLLKELELESAGESDTDTRPFLSGGGNMEDDEFPEVISTTAVRRKRNSKSIY